MYRKFLNIITQVFVCLALVLQACHEDSDMVVPYVNDGVLDFTEANSSFESQFKAIWAGMNSNYPIWDYEEKHGLNWDDVYDKYIESFRELDKVYDVHNPVPDSIVVSLYQEMFEPLHDGHLALILKNIHTQKEISTIISPSYSRLSDEADNMLRQEELAYLEHDFEPSLDYYVENGEIEELSEDLAFFSGNHIYGKFKDEIVYYRLPEFNLTEIFEKKEKSYYKSKYQIWECWFKTIQELHQENSLKGIIIDLRNNSGGSSADFQYVLGALLGGNITEDERKYQQVGFLRQKTGIARLDYSSLIPFWFDIYEDTHVHVEVPIVVLVNDLCLSMSEQTCLAAKQLKNGYVIGTKTGGGFSPIIPYSDRMSFVGSVGDLELKSAPFYIYIPDAAFFSMDKEIIEGHGIEPDETVCLDWSSHETTGKDNQLDRALEYLRSK